jgi:hypothetical protein
LTIPQRCGIVSEVLNTVAAEDSMSIVAIILINLAIIAFAAFAFWQTHSLWSILILLFMFGTRFKETKIRTKCPKCNHPFLAVEDHDEDEEEEG